MSLDHSSGGQESWSKCPGEPGRSLDQASGGQEPLSKCPGEPGGSLDHGDIVPGQVCVVAVVGIIAVDVAAVVAVIGVDILTWAVWVSRCPETRLGPRLYSGTLTKKVRFS